MPRHLRSPSSFERLLAPLPDSGSLMTSRPSSVPSNVHRMFDHCAHCTPRPCARAAPPLLVDVHCEPRPTLLRHVPCHLHAPIKAPINQEEIVEHNRPSCPLPHRGSLRVPSAEVSSRPPQLSSVGLSFTPSAASLHPWSSSTRVMSVASDRVSAREQLRCSSSVNEHRQLHVA